MQGHVSPAQPEVGAQDAQTCPPGLVLFLPQAWLWLQGTRHGAGHRCVLLWFRIAPPAGLGLEQGVTALFLGTGDALACLRPLLPTALCCISREVGKTFPSMVVASRGVVFVRRLSGSSLRPSLVPHTQAGVFPRVAGSHRADSLTHTNWEETMSFP